MSTDPTQVKRLPLPGGFYFEHAAGWAGIWLLYGPDGKIRLNTHWSDADARALFAALARVPEGIEGLVDAYGEACCDRAQVSEQAQARAALLQAIAALARVPEGIEKQVRRYGHLCALGAKSPEICPDAAPRAERVLQEIILPALAQPAPGTADEGGALREAFRVVDPEDWRRLEETMLDNSGHGRFWKSVMREVRAALASTPDRTEQPR